MYPPALLHGPAWVSYQIDCYASRDYPGLIVPASQDVRSKQRFKNFTKALKFYREANSLQLSKLETEGLIQQTGRERPGLRGPGHGFGL